MQVLVYRADSKQIAKEKKLEDLLRELPIGLHEGVFQRALRYRFERDAANFVLGRILLKQGLEELGLVDQLEKIQYQENSKPYLDSVFFNISHSDNLVVCAISPDGQLGIDVERIKDLNLADFTDWFTDKEWADIRTAKDSLRKFYWYWTRKESIIKALGVTLGYLNQIELDPSRDHFMEKGKKWFLRDLDVGEFFLGAVCTEKLVDSCSVISFS